MRARTLFASVFFDNWQLGMQEILIDWVHKYHNHIIFNLILDIYKLVKVSDLIEAIEVRIFTLNLPCSICYGLFFFQ